MPDKTTKPTSCPSCGCDNPNQLVHHGGGRFHCAVCMSKWSHPMPDKTARPVGMTISTTFAPGDTAWCICDGQPMPFTVGSVRVEHTDSTGVNGGHTAEEAPYIAFDNYKPIKSHKETYMMVETGIGSGRVFTLGKNIFVEEQDAYDAIADAKESQDA